MDRRSSPREDFVRVQTLIGLEHFEVGKSRSSNDFPFVSTLSLLDRGGGGGRGKKVASNQLKIRQRVAHG